MASRGEFAAANADAIHTQRLSTAAVASTGMQTQTIAHNLDGSSFALATEDNESATRAANCGPLPAARPALRTQGERVFLADGSASCL